MFQRDDRNFLVPGAREPITAHTYLDVSHEALLRRWPRFATDWLVEERQDSSELRRLADLADLAPRGRGWPATGSGPRAHLAMAGARVGSVGRPICHRRTMARGG